MIDSRILMNLDYLSMVELNERGRAVSRWIVGFRHIRPNRQGMGDGWSHRGRYRLEELTVVPSVSLSDGGICEMSTACPTFRSMANISCRIKVNRWPEKESWNSRRSWFTKSGLVR